MFDLIIVGAGHAGIEAAFAAARMQLSVLLVTTKLETIGELSCNPSIGGVGKGHLVKEIDALGGCMGFTADISGINFKKLNTSKGAAVQSTRIQVDRNKYKNSITNLIKDTKNIKIIQQTVEDIIIKNDKVIGIITENKIKIYSKTVILTLGTFLNGKIFIGDTNYPGGRMGEKPSSSLSEKLREYFPVAGRLKTGTPPRADIRSVCTENMGVQKSDFPIPFFSFWNKNKEKIKNKNCYISYTNNRTHEIIFKSINLSAVYNGSINVVGPRYCPSIEDKIMRFKEKTHHQIFLEPEGLNSYEFYLNGISTSLPFNIQYDFLKTIKGFEKIHITRPGYAVEYDFFDPRILNQTLETKNIKNLFFAGQINGTTGYEEAAVQGIMSGINAGCIVLNKNPFILSRSESYIGVLIDDLTKKGVDEPYRMFTSRVEHRILLREDNADLRLTEKARKLNLISDYKWKQFLEKYENLKNAYILLKNKKYKMFSEEFYKLNRFFLSTFLKNQNILNLLKYQTINYCIIKSVFNIKFNYDIISLIEIKIKYSGYINKQYNEINKLSKFKNIKIPNNINYNKIPGLLIEQSEKLNLIKPNNLEQASRIPGMTLSSILILLVYIKNKNDIS